jgi:hypothetical protein
MSMKLRFFFGLAALAVLVTGCPQNDYTLELTPRGRVLERKLIFYRADGTETNGAPKYQSFPSNELAAITAVYPPGAVTNEGERHMAVGEFAAATPGDIGGAGVYSNLTTSLGSAGFYAERFRGSDDLSAQEKKRLTAADQLADLVVGWSKAEFKGKPGHKSLRQFLDADFRRDLKNGGLYAWVGGIASSYQPQVTEEFLARFGLYLVERGYVRLGDRPLLAHALSSNNDSVWALLVQHLVADKLGVPSSGPAPEWLAFLADPKALEDSWQKFLANSAAYRARVREWEREKKLSPDAKKPEPSDFAAELLVALATSGSSGQDDHLTVRLSLPGAPDHTNGKWDDTRKQVVWDTPLEAKESAARLPVFCYAGWSEANSRFQQEHFGRTIISGDNLLSYGVWRAGLSEAQAGEWEKFLSGLRPGSDLTNRLANFEFAGESVETNGVAGFGKGLIREGLAKGQ